MKTIALTRGLHALVDDVDYPSLGQLKWQASPSRDGRRIYAVHSRAGQPSLAMHRVVLGLGPGDPGVDHVNGNGLDNQRTNLRLASAVQNGGNRRKTSKPTTSRFKGVTWDKARRHWRAEIKVNGKNHYLGYFDTEEEAASAYDTAATEAFGEYAYRNGGPSF